jgi:hypothetical protein
LFLPKLLASEKKLSRGPLLIFLLVDELTELAK